VTAAQHNGLVILLHGVGASGQDLAPLGEAWKPSLPGTAFAAPDAPHPFDHGQGRQWFSINGISTANRPERIRAARSDFDHTITAIVKRHGLSDRLDHGPRCCRVRALARSSLNRLLRPPVFA
jgi:phospholipase/carboxylesterase